MSRFRINCKPEDVIVEMHDPNYEIKNKIFWNLRSEMIEYAISCGNDTLAQALNYSNSFYDLCSCVKQSYGVSAERFQNIYGWLFDDLEIIRRSKLYIGDKNEK